MKNLQIKMMAKRLRASGKTYNEIGEILGVTLFSARKMCTYVPKLNYKKGPMPIIDKKIQLRIKRSISNLKSMGQKVNSTKIIKMADFSASTRTVQRYMKLNKYKYKKVPARIILSEKHKTFRVSIVTKWITDNHPWEKTIFSDEKRFSLDGPDDWRSYVTDSEKIMRNKHQCKGGSIMIWMMIFPSGLLSYRLVKNNLNSDGYISILNNTMVPMLRLNYGNDCFFQEDNCAVHKSKKVKEFMSNANVKVLEWPARSPDLNIAEDVWKLISEDVYDGPQFRDKTSLMKKINEVVMEINKNKRHLIQNLYMTLRSRLCTVLLKKGDLCNK